MVLLLVYLRHILKALNLLQQTLIHLPLITGFFCHCSMSSCTGGGGGHIWEKEIYIIGTILLIVPNALGSILWFVCMRQVLQECDSDYFQHQKSQRLWVDARERESALSRGSLPSRLYAQKKTNKSPLMSFREAWWISILGFLREKISERHNVLFHHPLCRR